MGAPCCCSRPVGADDGIQLQHPEVIVSVFYSGSSHDLLAQTKSKFEVDLNSSETEKTILFWLMNTDSSENPVQEFALKGHQQ